MRRAIVLFTGDPKREAIRKGVPARLLATLHRHLTATIRGHQEIRLVVASEHQGRFSLASEGVVEECSSDSLGAKIDSAFRFSFGLGCDSVILLAGDVAGVDLPLIEGAFATLGSEPERCVIGPSRDGGVYLLGLNRSGSLATSIEWNEIPWFAASTGAELIARASALGAQISFVRSVDDIDSLADAVRMTARLSPAFVSLQARLLSLLAASAVAPDRRFTVAPLRPRMASLFRGPPPA